MRRLSAKLERCETAGDSDESLRGVPKGVLNAVDMAEEPGVCGFSMGDGRFLTGACACSPPVSDGFDEDEVGCAIGRNRTVGWKARSTVSVGLHATFVVPRYLEICTGDSSYSESFHTSPSCSTSPSHAPSKAVEAAYAKACLRCPARSTRSRHCALTRLKNTWFC